MKKQLRWLLASAATTLWLLLWMPYIVVKWAVGDYPSHPVWVDRVFVKISEWRVY